MAILTSAFCLSLLFSAKVYAVCAAPLERASAAYAPTANENANIKSKLSNYFLHQPYGPNTYAFGYEVEDPGSGNVQFRDERRYVNGSIEGSYGYVRADGLIEVTHYRADAESGYLSQRQTYAARDKGVTAIWPTQRPHIIVESSKATAQRGGNVTWDEQSHLNVSVSAVAAELAQQLKQQHGLDLNHINVREDVLQPAVLDVVNGRTPLKTQPNGSMAFETVHNFIPSDFPIVPFELPTESTKQDIETKADNTYDQAKQNNDAKVQELGAEAQPTPKPLVNSSADAEQTASNWYEKIIEANRREFLQQLPNLS